MPPFTQHVQGGVQIVHLVKAPTQIIEAFSRRKRGPMSLLYPSPDLSGCIKCRVSAHEVKDGERVLAQNSHYGHGIRQRLSRKFNGPRLPMCMLDAMKVAGDSKGGPRELACPIFNMFIRALRPAYSLPRARQTLAIPVGRRRRAESKTGRGPHIHSWRVPC